MLDEVPNKIHAGAINRSKMPQVKFSEFLKYMNVNDILWTHMKINPKHLKASQGNFIEKKIEELKAGSKKFAPIFISSDLYVLDGHHRWLAQIDDEEIEVIKVDLVAKEALEACKNCSK